MVWKKRSSSNGFKWAILSYVEIAQGRDEIPSPFPGKHWIPDTSGGRSRTKLLQKWHVYPSGIKHGKLGRWIKFCKMRAPQIIQVINDHFGLKPTVTWGSTISVERPTTPGVMEKHPTIRGSTRSIKAMTSVEGPLLCQTSAKEILTSEQPQPCWHQLISRLGSLVYIPTFPWKKIQLYQQLLDTEV